MFTLFIMMGIGVLSIKQVSTATEKLTEDARGKALMLKIAAKDRKAFEAFYYLLKGLLNG